MTEHRRNPKRKAAETPAINYKIPENLLEESLRPLSASEIEGWEGWIEIESDPVSIPRRP
jgi:ubiquitin carboxyl-terminal hydrolase L5